MAKKRPTRGRTGTVRGMGDRKVRGLLQRVVRAMKGGEFARADVRAYLMEHEKLTRNQADGVMQAMIADGIAENVEYGVFALAPDAEELAAHWGWRLNVGRLPMADAEQLVGALGHERKTVGLSPRLEEVYQLGKKALRTARGRAR